MQNTLSKQIILSILGIALLLLAFVGVSYAIPNSFVKANSLDVILSYTSVGSTNTFDLSHLSAMADEEAQTTDSNVSILDFTVHSFVPSHQESSYQIVLKKEASAIIRDMDIHFSLLKEVNGVYQMVTDLGHPIYFLDNMTMEIPISRGKNENISSEPHTYMEKYRLKMWSNIDYSNSIDANYSVSIQILD